MRSYIIPFILSCVILSVTAISEGLSEEEIKMILGLKDECVKKTGVSDEIVMKTKDGVFTDDPLLDEFFFCMMTTFDFQAEDGTILKENIIGLMGTKLGEDVARKIADACAVPQSTPQKTAVHMSKCFFEHHSAMN